MSGVNVLAVIDELYDYMRTERSESWGEEIKEARAAVAELIESIDGYLSGRKWYNPLYANKQQYETFAAAEARLRAALSRVRGAA